MNADDLKGLRNFKKDFSQVRESIVVCLEKRSRATEDGIRILPYREFVRMLWEGKLTSG